MIDKFIPNFPVPVLPEAYDESASYYQLLMAMVNKLNDVIELAKSDHATVDEIRQQLEEILPYLDDLSHMGERFEAIQAEITALTERLYDATDGDINELNVAMQLLETNQQIIGIAAEQAQNAAMRTAQLSGSFNLLQEVSTQSTITSHGLTITKDSGTGWFHVTGTVDTDASFSVELGTYKIRDLAGTIPFNGSDAGSTAMKDHYAKFGALFSWNYIPRPSGSSFNSVVVTGLEVTPAQTQLFTQGTSNDGSPVIANINTSNNIRITLGFSAAMDEYSVDFWVCPSLYPPALTEWNWQISQYPLPISPLSNAELESELITERNTRIAQDTILRGQIQTEHNDRIDDTDGIRETLQAEINRAIGADTDLNARITREVNTLNGTINTVEQNLENDIQEIANNAATYGLGRAITDPAPSATPPVYADLFTLEPGKYYRNTNAGNVQNMPTGLTTAFIAIVENTSGTNRRRITVIPTVASRAGEMYVCLETGNGFGHWFKYTAVDITPES